jgi:hypothetical protein
MLIPGVPDNELELLHWNYGGGRGAVGLRHTPSGITVYRECLPNTCVWQQIRTLKVELEDKLRIMGSCRPAAEPEAS